jgi:biopolymer transport protein ExbB
MRLASLLLFTLLFVAWAGPSRAAAAEAPPAGEAAPATAAGTTATDNKSEAQSYLGWVIRSSGAIGLFILVLAVYFITSVVRLHASLRRDAAAPPSQLAALRGFLERRDHRAFIAFARTTDSHLCRVLSLGLLELPKGLAHARETMERRGEAETVELENRISMLAVLGTLGPMIGLIGTLKGMIASFSVIAMSEMQLRTSQVAGGISEALLLTFEGVALSVPAIYCFAVFRNRVSSISVWTMLHADTLLCQFDHSIRLKSALPEPERQSQAA